MKIESIWTECVAAFARLPNRWLQSALIMEAA